MKIDGSAHVVQRRRDSVLIGCLVLIWGCNWPLNKVVLTHISPLWFACLRIAMGSISLFLVQAFRTDGIKLPARADLPIVFSIGLVQVAAVMGLVQLGLSNVPAGRSAILSYTTPLWVVPGAILILGERLRLAKLAALLLGIGGVAVMFNPVAFNWSDYKAVIGNGYLLAAAALWAATIIHVRSHRWLGTPLTLAPWQMLIGLIPVSALAWSIEGPPPDVSFSLGALVLVVYSGPLITAFPFWALVTVSRAFPAVTTSLTLLLVPVIGLLSSVVFLSEQLNATSVVGLLLIISAVAVITLVDSTESGPTKKRSMSQANGTVEE
jgi:drug/metabolite transporter (DMT)-like permease